MADNIQRMRRTAKVLASLATLWVAFTAATIWKAPVTDSPRNTIVAAVVALTPILQLVLKGTGALKERSSPRTASLFYFAAVLLLVPQLLIGLA